MGVGDRLMLPNLVEVQAATDRRICAEKECGTCPPPSPLHSRSRMLDLRPLPANSA